MTRLSPIYRKNGALPCEVPKVLEHLRSRGLPMVTVAKEVGLAILEVRRPASVETTWSYLINKSNRGIQLAEMLRPLLHPGDSILEMYCGLSPLPPHLPEAREWWGYDIDPSVITTARARYPSCRWEVADDRYLAIAQLPRKTTVLVGLGLVRGHCRWDAQHVHANACFLLGRYAPRLCFFEAALRYYDADILGDLSELLTSHGYRVRMHELRTDLALFPERRVLIGERSLPVHPP